MLEFDLIEVPNQSFSTSIGDNSFEFHFRTFRDITYVSVLVNDELKSGSVRGTPNQSLFQKSVNDIAGGVFMFKCIEDDYPHYEKFNGSDIRFVFIPYEELQS